VIWNHTHLTGDDSQICLLGVCLLITKVPFWPSFTVSTPDCSAHQQGMPRNMQGFKGLSAEYGISMMCVAAAAVLHVASIAQQSLGQHIFFHLCCLLQSRIVLTSYTTSEPSTS
jgi:hypothetical protein